MENLSWRYSNAPGRWAGFGPYYAMFPVNFARKVVESLTPLGGSVLDPFCGRGTAPFVAQATGRISLGIDRNPVAWVFSKVKTTPEPRQDLLLNRLCELKHDMQPEDSIPENEFQEWAWSDKVLGFLNSARRNLDWQLNTTDRTLMGFILVSLHAKLGDGISNQMQKARAVGPSYAVRWWKSRNLHPPQLDPFEYIQNRINWRYRHGIINHNHKAEILLGDSAKILSRYKKRKFDLVFTSPPYFSITDYRQDSWIRLWLLNEGPSLPDWKKDSQVSKRDSYAKLLANVFSAIKRLLQTNGLVWVRTDAREFTRETTQEIIRSLWPRRHVYLRYDLPKKNTQTAHFGNPYSKSGEVDFLIPGRKPLPCFLSDWQRL